MRNRYWLWYRRRGSEELLSRVFAGLMSLRDYISDDIEILAIEDDQDYYRALAVKGDLKAA